MPGKRYTRLVGDIGGTHARFALLAAGSDQPEYEQTLASSAFPDLAAAATEYLTNQGNPPVDEAAIAVATAITNDRIKLTNNDWTFSVAGTRNDLGLERLILVNDFTALAMSLPMLGPEECRQVGAGTPESNTPIGLIGPGTGLGVSGLIPGSGSWIPLEGEGGHAAFSPMTPRETDVLKLLWRHYDHVSTERVVSGPGLVTLRETLATLDGLTGLEPLSPEQVAARGMAASDPHCAEALDMFCGILGTAAANLCVTFGARAGVYIGGGIVPALGTWFDRSAFRRRFEQKGRFRSYVAAVPTFVITAHNPALRGAARAFASR
ncbi:MAG: glucokinase [Betaproteobacteria bacterium]